MLRIAVVEDEQASGQMLLSHIRRFEQETGTVCRADRYTDGKSLLRNYEGQYDLLFLDIQMEGPDGLATAQRIRQTDESVILVFVTNLAQYAIRGYGVRASNFLLKPVSYYVLSEELARAAQIVNQDKNRYMAVKTETGLQKIEIGSIAYLETLGRRLLIHAGGREYSCRETLKTMEEKLVPEGFFRCHNVYLVNLARVENVSQSTVTVGGQELLLSRYKRKEFLDALARFMGNRR